MALCCCFQAPELEDLNISGRETDGREDVASVETKTDEISRMSSGVTLKSLSAASERKPLSSQSVKK